MNQNIKQILQIFLTLASLILTVLITEHISHYYFFDKFYYKKSPDYGYIPSEYHTYEDDLNIYKKRAEDIILLKDLSQTDFHPEELPEDTYTIAFIGDSFVWGTGVKFNNSVTQQLEKKLNKQRPTKVYSLAMSGDNMIENYTKFKTFKEHLHADLYIYGVIANDIVVNKDYRYTNDGENLISFIRSCSDRLPFIENISDSDSNLPFSEFVKKYYINAISSEYSNSCIFEKITKEFMSSDENIMFFSFFPYPKHINKCEATYSYMQAYISDLLTKSGADIKYYDDPIDPYERVSPKEGHSSVRLHKAYADYLYELIITDPQYGF